MPCRSELRGSEIRDDLHRAARREVDLIVRVREGGGVGGAVIREHAGALHRHRHHAQDLVIGALHIQVDAHLLAQVGPVARERGENSEREKERERERDASAGIRKSQAFVRDPVVCVGMAGVGVRIQRGGEGYSERDASAGILRYRRSP